MKITVAICTWNRCSLLRKTLEALMLLEDREVADWELVVVDNNSTDATALVLDEFRDKLPLTVFSETRQGHSHARNRAIAESKGDYIIWIDDDVIVDKRFLVAYSDAFEMFPDADFFGGPIIPWFEAAPPQWIARHLDSIAGAFALKKEEDTLGRITSDNLPFGANLVTKRTLFEKNHFDPRLGRIGNQLTSADETTFIGNAISSGSSGIWVSSALVKHFVPKERMTVGYLYRFYSGLTQTCEPSSLERFPYWAARLFLVHSAVRFLNAPFRNRLWITSLKKAASYHGFLQGWQTAIKMRQ